jgi:hypothetical protein
MSPAEAMSLLEQEREDMQAVSTGEARIQDLNTRYKERRVQIARGLRLLGVSDPNLHSDLWAWHGKWSNGDLPTYRSRREYLRDLFTPIVESLQQRANGGSASPRHEPTGWPRVDRDLDRMRFGLETAQSELEFQQVGLACREILISVGQAVFDPSRHALADGVAPSSTDAYRMIEAYFAHELSGSSHEAIRSHAKSACKLAVDLQHRRTADRRSALLCAEATRTVVNLAAVVSGHLRDFPCPSGS